MQLLIKNILNKLKDEVKFALFFKMVISCGNLKTQPQILRWSSVFLPSESGRACDCFEQQSTVEVTLCIF